MGNNRLFKVLSILFLLLPLNVGQVAANSIELFSPYVTYPAGSPYAVGIGDFNHDGRNDIALSNSAGELKIFLQDDAGDLDNAVTYAAGTYPEALAVGDLNNDGWDDVVVTNSNNNTISVFLQQADGTLAARTTYATGMGPDSVAVGDVNGDDLDDVAVSNWNSPFISIFIQNTNHTLNAKVDYASPQAGYDDIAIGDVNGDGLNDVVKMNGQFYSSPDLSVYLQSGGSLQSAVSYSVAGNNLGHGIGLGDVTGDGRADVVMSYGANNPTAFIAVFAQALDGSLQPPVSYGAYDVPEAVEVGDVNNDDLADIIVAHGGWDAISVYLQQGNGILDNYTVYTLPDNSASHYRPQGLKIGDVNGDALPDVLIANYNFGLNLLYHLPLPAAFDKTGPLDKATNQLPDVTLSWSSSANAGHYEYCYYMSGDGCTTWFNNGTSTSKTISNLEPGATYYWHVRSVNGIGTVYSNGTDAAYWSFTIKSSDILHAKAGGLTSGNCDTWENACELSFALSSSIAGDEIWVAAGIYKPGANRTDTFQLVDGVAVYGGFPPTGDPGFDDRDPAIYLTILSGDLDGDDAGFTNNSENAYHVVTGSGTDSTAVLDGVTISRGNANGVYPHDSGGGMVNISSSPTLIDITFIGNAALYGGGMFSYGGAPNLTDVTFINNIAEAGGGIANVESNPILTDVTFSDSSATIDGGGMYNLESTPSLTNASFSDNNAGRSGGGMKNLSSDPSLIQVTFNGNTAGEDGGGISNTSGSPTLTDITFTGNTAPYGGGVYNFESTSSLTDVTFSDNLADYGGGMLNFRSTTSLTNVTFSSNSANYGGGMTNSECTTSLTNVTFSDNSASSGGGMYNYDSGPTIRNTILWGNTATNGAQIYNEGISTPIVSYSVVQGGYAGGTNILTADPVLGELTDYGGAGKLVFPLRDGSSAIDTGNDSLCPATDQRGLARPQGAHCDIGAYESNPRPGKAILSAPSGDIGPVYYPTYTWGETTESQTELAATWYYLWVNAPSGKAVIKQWYQGTNICNLGTCAVTPATPLGGGTHTWWVQTWNSAGYGPWSDPMTFTPTTPAAPGKASLTSPSGNIGLTESTTYTWQEYTGEATNAAATWYYLWVNDATNKPIVKGWYKSRDICDAGSCAVTAATAKDGGTHTWWVQTWNAAGLGPWSDPMTFSTAIPTAPGKANLTSPNGTAANNPPTYTWSKVTEGETESAATWYYLWVNDATNKPVVKQWYEASTICDEGACEVTPATILSAGAHTWWVQTWNTAGYGPWSDPLTFSVP